MGCLITGCDNDPRSRFTMKVGRMCEEHWRKLPMALRQEYWKETDFGNIDPSEEFANKLREHFNGNKGELSKAEDTRSSQQIP